VKITLVINITSIKIIKLKVIVMPSDLNSARNLSFNWSVTDFTLTYLKLKVNFFSSV
jgi:hypothetical protein